jgi:two-component system, NarL family, response regulator DegU
MSVTVLIADDREILREAIRDVLNLDPDIKIVGEVDDFPQTIALMRGLNPNVVVLDLHMPAPPDFSFGEIKRAVTDAGSKLITISIWQDEPSRALAASFGSRILLDKSSLGTSLIPAIRQLNGIAIIPVRVA